MPHPHEGVNELPRICAGAGHEYIQVTLIRCKHEESYRLWAAGWTDVNDEYAKQWFHQRVEYGPFDSLLDIRTSAIEHVENLFGELTGYEPL